jgi:hypothetical protein
MSHLIIYLLIFIIIGCAFVFGSSGIREWPASFNIWYSVQMWTFFGVLAHHFFPGIIPPFKGFMPAMSFVYGIITVIIAAIYAGPKGLAPWLLAAILIFSSIGIVSVIVGYLSYRNIIMKKLCKFGPRMGWSKQEIEHAFKRFGLKVPKDCDKQSTGKKTWAQSLGIKSDAERNKELDKIGSEMAELEAKRNNASLPAGEREAAGHALSKKQAYKKLLEKGPKKTALKAGFAGLRQRRQEASVAKGKMKDNELKAYGEAHSAHETAKKKHQAAATEEKAARERLGATTDPQQKKKAEAELAGSKKKSKAALDAYSKSHEELSAHEKKFGKSYEKAKLESCKKSACSSDERSSLQKRIADGASRASNDRDLRKEQAGAARRDHDDKKRQYAEDKRLETDAKARLHKAAPEEKGKLQAEVDRLSGKTDASLKEYQAAHAHLEEHNSKDSMSTRIQDKLEVRKQIRLREAEKKDEGKPPAKQAEPAKKNEAADLAKGAPVTPGTAVPGTAVPGTTAPSGAAPSTAAPAPAAKPPAAAAKKANAEAEKLEECEEEDESGAPISKECKQICDSSVGEKPDFCDARLGDAGQSGGGSGEPSKATVAALGVLEIREIISIIWGDVYQVWYNFTLFYIFGLSDILFGVIWLIIALVGIGKGDLVLLDGIGSGVADFLATGGEDGGPLTLWDFIVSWKWQLLFSTLIIMGLELIIHLFSYIGTILRILLIILLIVILWLIFGHPILHLISELLSWIWNGIKWIFSSIWSGMKYLFSSVFSLIGNLAGTLFG